MSNPTKAATTSLRQTALGDLEQELATTRRVLERIPDEHLDWKPHPKSWSLGSLASHLANLPTWQSTILGSDGLDMATVPPPQGPPASRAEVLERFDGALPAVRAAMEGATDEALMASWTLRHGDRVIMSQPRLAIFRAVGISHMVHHRAQLGVYLRLLDVPVPSMYGPSADEGGS